MKKLVLNEELSRIKKLMIEQENNYDSDESGSVEFSHERDGKTYPFLVDDDIVDIIPASLDLLDRVIDGSDMDEREKRNLLVLISYLLHNALNEVSHEISTDDAIKIWDQISKN